jgi:hypothetical protein
MRRVRVVLGLAVAVCAFGALSAPAFAKGKEKLVFGNFAASIVGKTISPSSPATIVENKEDEAEVTGLQLGIFKFGVLNSEKKPEYEEPCEKAPKVTGAIENEVSSSLLLNVQFKKCVTSSVKSGSVSATKSSFKLGFRFKSNESAEIGNTQGGIEIVKSAVVIIKGESRCVVEIPAQTVPARAAGNEEKFWEGAEYTPEKEEGLEGWETHKKLQEQYPGNFKNRLEIETLEKFKGIVSYVHPFETRSHICAPVKGEESGKLVTEKEIEVEGKMVPNPYYGDIEYTNGKVFMNIEGLEIKGGQLTFEPPA